MRLENTTFLSMMLAANERDDDLGFFALKVVDSAHSKQVAQLLVLRRLSSMMPFVGVFSS